MDTILQKLGLERLIPTFEAESISPDIVCKLSLYEMNCLGVTNRSHVMNLRTECVSYGSFQPLKRKSESAGPSEFVITKSELDNLLSIGFQIKEIAQLLSVSESTIYRRMRMFGLSKRDFTSIDDTELSHFVRDIVEEFPNCGEVMLNQILTQKGIKVCISSLVVKNMFKMIPPIDFSE